MWSCDPSVKRRHCENNEGYCPNTGIALIDTGHCNVTMLPLYETPALWNDSSKNKTTTAAFF